MMIKCPDCGAEGQEVGKYCENCGRLLSDVDAQAQAGTGTATPAGPATAPTTAPVAGTDAQPAQQSASADAAAGAAGAQPQAQGVRFAIVGLSGPDPTDGFTITQVGEYLLGRPNVETGVNPDIDLRQWVQPMEIGGQRMYLVHRCQCYLGLSADGTVTIRPCPGSELDTLVKPAGQPTFMSMPQLGAVRTALPDPAGAFPLQTGDQVFMGDPEALRYFQSGSSTAQGSYLVLELMA